MISFSCDAVGLNFLFIIYYYSIEYVISDYFIVEKQGVLASLRLFKMISSNQTLHKDQLDSWVFST